MGRREKPPRPGERITSRFLTDVHRQAYEPAAMGGGQGGSVDGAFGMHKPIHPFLAIVTETFSDPASAGADDASSGSAKRLFLGTGGDYDIEYGDEFVCYSHHYLPIDGDRIWVIWNENSARFEMLAGSWGQIIQFRFVDFQDESNLVANCTVYGADDGRLIGQTVQVHDESDEGCYFGDETESELSDRTGFAAFMQYEQGSTRTAKLVVFALCCPPGS